MAGATEAFQNKLDQDKQMAGFQLPENFEETFRDLSNRQALEKIVKASFEWMDETIKNKISEKCK